MNNYCKLRVVGLDKSNPTNGNRFDRRTDKFHSTTYPPSVKPFTAARYAVSSWTLIVVAYHPEQSRKDRIRTIRNRFRVYLSDGGMENENSYKMGHSGRASVEQSGDKRQADKVRIVKDSIKLIACGKAGTKGSVPLGLNDGYCLKKVKIKRG